MKFPVYFPRSKRKFNTISGCINHILRGNFYKDQIDAYQDVHNLLESPKCKFCGDDAEFIGFSKGYLKRCSSDICKNKTVTDANRKIAINKKKYENKEYVKFIYKNLCFYRDLLNKNEPYFDTFFGENVSNPICFIGCKAKLKNFEEERICVITGEKFKINVLKEDNIVNYFVGSSKKSRHYRKFTIDEIMYLLKKKHEFEITNSYEVKSKIYSNMNSSHKKRFICDDKETVKYINDIIRNRILFFHGYSCKSGSIKPKLFNLSTQLPKDVLKINYNNLFGCCCICGKEYEINHVYYDLNLNEYFLKKVGGKYTCSRDCYFKILENKNNFYSYPEEVKIKQSEDLKRKIENGEWTPNTTNSWCKSRVSTKDNKNHFRSTWEAVFYVYMKYENNINLTFENIRIPYLDYNNKKRVYLVDFEDKNNKILYEVKPNSSLEKDINSALLKEKSAIKWCEENGYKFIYITEKEMDNIVNFELLEQVLKTCNIDKQTLYKRMNKFLS